MRKIICSIGGKTKELWTDKTFENTPRRPKAFRDAVFDAPIVPLEDVLEDERPKIPLGRQIALLKSIRGRVKGEERTAIDYAIDSLYDRSELYWKAYQNGYYHAVRKGRES